MARRKRSTAKIHGSSLRLKRTFTTVKSHKVRSHRVSGYTMPAHTVKGHTRKIR